MGEFGRTPRMNADAGRDHWGDTFSVLMGCGAMKMGQVIGKSNARGEYVVDRPISPQDVPRRSTTTWASTVALGHLRRSNRAPDLPDRERRADPRAGGVGVFLTRPRIDPDGRQRASPSGVEVRRAGGSQDWPVHPGH